MSTDATPIETLLRRERLIVCIGLALLMALSWSWVLVGSGTGMSALAMSTWTFPPPVHAAALSDWNAAHAIVMFFMWWIMMIAMMTPSAAPTILLYARAYRHENRAGKIEQPSPQTFAFALGYLVAWLGFSLVATGLQWALERAGILHATMMWSIEPLATASLLLAAGVYQLTPSKSVCLEHCRSPAQFLAANFQPGARGALRMGMRHGAFCLGCCWLLMALLFAGGIMNLVWIAGLSIIVLVEKILPHGPAIARTLGVVMVATGLLVLARDVISPGMGL